MHNKKRKGVEVCHASLPSEDVEKVLKVLKQSGFSF